MNFVKKVGNHFRQNMNSPLYRYLPILVGIAAVVGIAVLAYWLPIAQSRQNMKEFEAVQALKAVQNDLAEIERLRSRALSPKLTGEVLRQTLAASLSSFGNSMSVDLIDTDHVRLHGTGSFDVVMGWLGDAQQSHRFDVEKMDVRRQDDSVSFDMTLSLAQE